MLASISRLALAFKSVLFLALAFFADTSRVRCCLRHKLAQSRFLGAFRGGLHNRALSQHVALSTIEVSRCCCPSLGRTSTDSRCTRAVIFAVEDSHPFDFWGVVLAYQLGPFRCDAFEAVGESTSASEELYCV